MGNGGTHGEQTEADCGDDPCARHWGDGGEPLFYWLGHGDDHDVCWLLVRCVESERAMERTRMAVERPSWTRAVEGSVSGTNFLCHPTHALE